MISAMYVNKAQQNLKILSSLHLSPSHEYCWISATYSFKSIIGFIFERIESIHFFSLSNFTFLALRCDKFQEKILSTPHFLEYILMFEHHRYRKINWDFLSFNSIFRIFFPWKASPQVSEYMGNLNIDIYHIASLLHECVYWARWEFVAIQCLNRLSLAIE